MNRSQQVRRIKRCGTITWHGTNTEEQAFSHFYETTKSSNWMDHRAFANSSPATHLDRSPETGSVECSKRKQKKKCIMSIWYLLTVPKPTTNLGLTVEHWALVARSMTSSPSTSTVAHPSPPPPGCYLYEGQDQEEAAPEYPSGPGDSSPDGLPTHDNDSHEQIGFSSVVTRLNTLVFRQGKHDPTE